MTKSDAAENRAGCLSGQVAASCNGQASAQPVGGRHAGADEAGAARRRAARTAERRRAARASALAADYGGSVA